MARMALLLAGLPKEISGSTVNRLCGSSLDALAVAARGIKSGEVDLVIAGGVESMSRAPFVMGKAESGVFTRDETRRYDHWLAVCESGDEGEVWNRRDAGDRGNRGGRI